MSVLSARSHLANEVKKAKASGETAGQSSAVQTARQELAAAKIAAYVKRVVAEAPPLTDEQRARLACLFAGLFDPPVALSDAVGSRPVVVALRERRPGLCTDVARDEQMGTASC